MAKFLHNRNQLVAVIGIALVVGWWLCPGVRGYVAAQFDVARGKYEIQGYGLPAKWRPEYVRLLKERHGIQHRTVAGVVSRSRSSYFDAYNAAIQAAAKCKFGRDVIDECAADAQRSVARSDFDFQAETQRFLKLEKEADLLISIGYGGKVTLWPRTNDLAAPNSATIATNEFSNTLHRWQGPRRLALVEVPSEIIGMTNAAGIWVEEITPTARFAVTHLRKAGFKDVLLETKRWGQTFEFKLKDEDQP